MNVVNRIITDKGKLRQNRSVGDGEDTGQAKDDKYIRGGKRETAEERDGRRLTTQACFILRALFPTKINENEKNQPMNEQTTS